MDRDTVLPHIRVPLPGPNTRRWAAYHRRVAARSTYVEGFVWDRSQPAIGPFCTDPDGNVILDFASHVGTSALGYNHPKLCALAEKLSRIDPDRYAGTDFIAAYGEDPETSEIPTPSHLHHKLLEITSQFGFGSAFFSNSGAEAVENAIKVCYDYRRNYGYGFCFLGAFHGRTLGALSLNRSKKVHRGWYPQIPHILHFPYCRCRAECRCGWMTRSPGKEGWISRMAQVLDREIGLVHLEEVAYIILEPIQGEGGLYVPSPAFVEEVGRIAQEYQIPLIADEVQSGLGRTGKWWAVEHFGLKPDLIVAAKALRIGATIGREELFPREDVRLGSTWGEGNAISSAIGYRTIEIIQRESLLDNAARLGEYFLGQLRRLQERYEFVTDVRGIGLMDAIELDSRERWNRVLRGALQRGLLLLGCGHQVVRFLPPLNVTRREIDLAVEILDQTLAAE